MPGTIGDVGTVGALAAKSPTILAGIRRISDGSVPIESYVTQDLTSLVLRFEYQLFPDVGRVFLLHTRAYEHRPYLGFYPTTAFSGLVIYAKGDFPVHGEEGRTERLVPAIMPRIFDESMNLIVESGMVDPAVAVARGIVGYTESDDLFGARGRVGDVPLVTMARAIYGDNRTDVIIPDETANRILASEANRKLITDGKILIICDLGG